LSSPADIPDLDLAALVSSLADGTLEPARRAEVQARIDSSPELRALYARERRVVERLHEARATDRAPASLRARIDAQRPSAARRARRRFGYGGALAGALAGVITALALILPAGSGVAPSISQAAALATRGIAAPAPSPDPSAPGRQLDKNIQGLYFPDWQRRFGWAAVGQRSDTLHGRRFETVYYKWQDDQLAYTIAETPPLKTPAAEVTWLGGTKLWTLTLHGRTVVTWRRAGHTCILSASTVPAAELQKLAAWHVPGDSSAG
jgi:hypothetical protein